MIKKIVLVSILILQIGCSQTISQTDVRREVPTITFESILLDQNLQSAVQSMDESNKAKFRIWINDKLIPYVSYLENGLQYSTPN